MRMKKIMSILLALLLAAMVVVPMVSAEGNTSEQSDAQPSKESRTSLITLDGLSKSIFQIMDEKPSSEAISSSIEKYDVIDIDAKTLKAWLKSGKKVPVRINGVPYLMDLHEETFYPSEETGIYTFNGKLVSVKDSRTLPESSVQLTLDDEGVLGHISVDSSETIYLDEVPSGNQRIPEQQIAFSSNDITPDTADLTNDLITELPSGEIKPIAQLSEAELEWLNTKQYKTASIRTSASANAAVLDSMVDVNLLIATDNKMYTSYSNWKKRAQSVLNDANAAFGVNEIKIRLVPIYDDSKRIELSQNFDPLHPFDPFASIFNNAYLDSKGADIAIYLSGKPFVGSAVGLSKGFDSGDEYRQAIMSYEAMPPGYGANPQSRAYVFTHELGHLFDGAHEIALNQNELYNRATTYLLNGVSKQTTMCVAVSQDPLIFSTDDGIHGDSNHNNALRLKETKGIVSGYTY